MEVSDQLHASAVLPPGESSAVHNEGRCLIDNCSYGADNSCSLSPYFKRWMSLLCNEEYALADVRRRRHEQITEWWINSRNPVDSGPFGLFYARSWAAGMPPTYVLLLDGPAALCCLSEGIRYQITNTRDKVRLAAMYVCMYVGIRSIVVTSRSTRSSPPPLQVTVVLLVSNTM
jgi:hypothetical protein